MASPVSDGAKRPSAGTLSATLHGAPVKAAARKKLPACRAAAAAAAAEKETAGFSLHRAATGGG